MLTRSALTRLRSRLSIALCAALLPLSLASNAQAAGTLTPAGSLNQPIQIRDHHLEVVINNGFARTEVLQTFFNPNTQDLEGVYAFPVPESASLSEFNITAGETQIDGEVVPKAKANQIYEEERNQGNDAGVANRNSYQTFEFKVARIPAQKETKIRFVYYQPLTIDTGVGRYVYPLEDGGTDEVAKSFWVTNSKVENSFSAQIDVRMAVPVQELRVPGFENAAQVQKLADDHQRISIQQASGSLNRDIVVYYRLADTLPGRIELLPYRADPAKPGSFMLVLTPGMDLQPITRGADYSFILDVSGSMSDKLSTLARGVSQAISQLRPQDRFRIVTFNDNAQEIVGWQSASAENVAAALNQVRGLQSAGSTNLYDGLELGLKDLDADRVTSVVLVTDGVTNTGILDAKEFVALTSKYDVRLFGFLMGNSSNWPLLRVICEASGGFYSAVSNSDDIVGQILLAKSKITSEALHNVSLKIQGVQVSDTTEQSLGKVYRGQQVAIFGQYAQGGRAKVTLKTALSGEDKTYETEIVFPESDTEYPEVERLWAMNRIEAIERMQMLGKLPEAEGKQAIESLGVQYQLVTDETSMLVLSDEGFKKHNIARNNQARVALENAAQSSRATQPVRSFRADQQQPMFGSNPAPHIFRGGGAIDGYSVIAIFILLGSAVVLRRPRKIVVE